MRKGSSYVCVFLCIVSFQYWTHKKKNILCVWWYAGYLSLVNIFMWRDGDIVFVRKFPRELETLLLLWWCVVSQGKLVLIYDVQVMYCIPSSALFKLVTLKVITSLTNLVIDLSVILLVYVSRKGWVDQPFAWWPIFI